MIHRIISFLKIFAVALVVCAWGATANAAGDCLDALRADLGRTITTNITDDDMVIVNSDSLVEFFTKNINICRDYLLARTSDEDIAYNDIDLIVNVDWEYLTEQVSAALTVSAPERILFVCENDKGYMGAIDIALWAGTIVAAVFSFGSGGVVLQSGRAAVVQGFKSLTRVGVRKGTKKAAIEAAGKKIGVDIAKREAAVAAARQTLAASAEVATEAAAKQAVKTATTAVSKNATVVAIKGRLHAAGRRNVTDKMLKTELTNMLRTATARTHPTKTEIQKAMDLVDDKIAKRAAAKSARKALNEKTAQLVGSAEAALLADSQAATNALTSALKKFAISTPIAALGGWAAIYSWLSDDLNPAVMNCTNTDAGEYCYLSCTKDNLSDTSDDLNTKVFRPILGKNLCVDEDHNYVLREIASSGLPLPGDVAKIPESQWPSIRSALKEKVVDQGKCDWNEDDIDMYIAAPMYDQSTLQPTGDGSVGLIVDVLRLDE